ncbi:MAG: tetratricopeptide repeat protein, partial [Anaerolineae bacterium]|uniref:tetratricopeptide repeat protein n=1 Tax=Thermoflexus sp. TaxID=1969742 RepID=UPI0025E63122
MRELNYRRERFAKRPGPVVFLTDSITLGQVMRHAADLFAVRSGIFDLRPPLPPRADQWMLISETITQDLPGSWARPPEFPLSPEQQEGARRWARHLEEQVKREERRPTPNRARLAVLYRELAELAASLGEWERAVEFGQRTVGALRPLAQAHPEAFRADLAKSLSNLGNMLSALGRREEALQATQEAIHFYRSLAEQHPQAFLPDLAGSLTNLGAVLSALGRREEALQATQEAVHLYRQLAAQHPDAFLPALAASLNNLGNVL